MSPKEEPIAGKRLPWGLEPGRIISRKAAATLIERIADVAPLCRARGATRLRLALEPAALGELVIDLLIRGPELQGRVSTGSEAARDLILSQLDELRLALAHQGIQVGEFQVSVDPSFGEGQEDTAESCPGGSANVPAERIEAGLRSIRAQTLDLLA